MAQEQSFSAVPEAPSFRPPVEPDPLTTSEDSGFITPSLDVPQAYRESYPKLCMHAYHIKRDSLPSNVLAFVHNAAKREIADFISIVLPSLEKYAATTNHASMENTEWEYLDTWWSMLLRVFFYVAETDDNVVRLMLEPARKNLKKQGELKRSNALARCQKSLEDRYAFSMELVLKAANRAMEEYMDAPHDEHLAKAIEKMKHVVNFMLDVMDQSMDLALEVEDICDIALSRLEGSVADALFTFVKGNDRAIFVYMCARWMNDEALIRQWIVKYGGIRARWFFDNWKKAHQDSRVAFIDGLASKYLSS